jgi:drug/metabolite transporter (DMT)-like permease
MLPRGHFAKGIACLAVAILSWGAMFPIAKRTLPVLDAYSLGSIRYAIGTLIFVALLVAFEGRRALAYEGRLAAASVFGVVGFTGFNVFVWLGLASTRPEHASIIMSLQTPLVALAVWLTRGQRPAAFTLGCAAAAIAGVVLVVTAGDPAQAFAHGTLAGDALVVLGAVSWVVYSLAGGRFAGWSPLRMTVLTCIPGAIGLLVAHGAAIALGWAQPPTLDAVLSVKWQIGYFAVFTVVLGVLCFNAGVKFLGALNTMLMLNLVPVTVFAIEAALGRSFAPIELAGAALVIGALVANNLYLRRMSRTPA